jgi:hypothetical protein
LLPGWIAGAVLDSGLTPVSAKVLTYTGIDSVATFSEVSLNGNFQLSDLPEKTYSVAIIPDDPSLLADTVYNINVIRQQPTPMGAIHLKYK